MEGIGLRPAIRPVHPALERIGTGLRPLRTHLRSLLMAVKVFMDPAEDELGPDYRKQRQAARLLASMPPSWWRG